MRFYQVIAAVTDEKRAEENNDRCFMRQRTRRIAHKIDEFNQHQGGKAYYNEETTLPWGKAAGISVS